MRKKILCILSLLFVALLLMQSFISIFAYNLKLQSVRSKVKLELLNKVEESKLVLVKVARTLEQTPNNQFKKNHDKEFEFLGEMYDVVNTVERRDTTYYYCYQDRDESDIIRGINRWIKDNFGNSKEKNETEDIQKVFFEKDYEVATLFCYPSFAMNESDFFIEGTTILVGFTNCFAPPPELNA
jgi:hypothetical protein